MRLSPEMRWRLYYRVEEAGGLLGWSRSTSYRAARHGDMPIERDGKFMLVPRGQWDLKVRRVRERLLRVAAKAAEASASP